MNSYSLDLGSSVLASVPMIRGEMPYSWLVRFHYRLGHRSFRNTLDTVFKSSHVRFAIDFPSQLNICEPLCGMAIRDIVNVGTPLRLYKSFCNKDRYSAVRRALCNGNASAAQSSLSAVANRLTPSPHLQFCKSCIERDKELLGIPLWHSDHQLLGVQICSHHHEPLYRVKRANFCATLPNKRDGELCSKYIEAADSFSQLEHDSWASPIELSQDKLLKVYKRKLHEFGFITTSGGLRVSALSRDIQQHWLKAMSGKVFDKIRTDLISEKYPQCLFYSPNSNHHPLKHLLMIGFLYGEWNSFVDDTSFDHSIDEKQVPAPRANVSDNEMSDCCALYDLDNQSSLRAVSRQYSVSVTRARSIALQNGIKIKRRTQFICEDVRRNIWRQLHVGLPTKDIAERSSVSICAVEQILTAHPELLGLRKKIRFFNARTYHRQKLAYIIEKYPRLSRSALRKKVSASYMWLFKSDKPWLNSMLK